MARKTDPELARQMGRQLNTIRSQFQLTQAEAAKRIGMHVNQWAKYERGEREIPLRWMKAIRDAFHRDLAMPAAVPVAAHQHPPEYYKGMLEAGRKITAAGQLIMEEAMDGLTAAAVTPSADRLAAAAGAVAVRAAHRKGPRVKRTG